MIEQRYRAVLVKQFCSDWSEWRVYDSKEDTYILTAEREVCINIAKGLSISDFIQSNSDRPFKDLMVEVSEYKGDMK